MGRFGKVIILSLNFLVFCHHAHASFIQDVNDLRLAGCLKTIDMKPFQEKWGASLKDLFLNQYHPDGEPAEKELNTYMQALVDLLKYNYNADGVQMLSSFASTHHLLELAEFYYHRGDQLTRLNRPPAGLGLHEVSTNLFVQVWKRVQEERNTCLAEYSSQSEALLDPDMIFIKPSKRNFVKNTIVKAVATYSSHESKLPQNLLMILGQHVMYCLDPFLPEQMKSYAWCANRVLGRADLTKELYEYSRHRSSVETNQDIGDFVTWLRSAGPRPEEKACSCSAKL